MMKKAFYLLLIGISLFVVTGQLLAHGPGHKSFNCPENFGETKQEGYLFYGGICYRAEFSCSFGLEDELEGFRGPVAANVWYDEEGLRYNLGVSLDGAGCFSEGAQAEVVSDGSVDKMSYRCDFEGYGQASLLIHQVRARHCPANDD